MKKWTNSTVCHLIIGRATKRGAPTSSATQKNARMTGTSSVDTRLFAADGTASPPTGYCCQARRPPASLGARCTSAKAKKMDTHGTRKKQPRRFGDAAGMWGRACASPAEFSHRDRRWGTASASIRRGLSNGAATANGWVGRPSGQVPYPLPAVLVAGERSPPLGPFAGAPPPQETGAPPQAARRGC